MRKLYILLFTLAAACCLIGCTRENVEETTGSGDVIIRLKVDALETKSAANEDENYVENLQLLFFKNVSAAPTKYLNLTSEITAGVGPFEKSYATVTAFGDFTYTELKDAVVFAVANYATDLSTVSSLSDAKSKVVDASGFLVDSDGWKVKDGPRFVMTAEGGFGTGTGTDAGKAVADLTLRRLASKVSLRITYDSIDPPITTEDVANKTITAWTPMSEGNVRVYLSNAVNNAKLEGNADTPGLFTYADNHPTGEGTLSSSAFYTYPTSWAEGSDDAPFIKIIQPWSYKTVKYTGTSSADPGNSYVIDENVVELYYKVLFPGITSLASNTWYQPTVKLNVLGGESNRNMAELATTGFDILPWGSVSSTGGELSPVVIEPAKYISMERNETIVNNGNTVSIRYVASGATTLSIVRIYKEVFTNDNTAVREIYPTKDALVDDDYVGDGGTGSIASNSSDAWFGNSYGTERPNEGFITLKHSLSTSFIENSFAARPYTYVLKLHLDSEGLDTSLDRTFYIIQNPALLVDGQMSTGWICINNIHSNNAYKAAGNAGLNPPYPLEGTNYYLNGYQPRTSEQGSYSPKPYVKLPDNRYIYTYWYAHTTWSGNETRDNNLGVIDTYDYLDPTKNNACRWRILIRPSTSLGSFILDPRIDLTKSLSDKLNNILNYYVTSSGGSSSPVEGSPLSASESGEIKKYRPAAQKLDNLSTDADNPDFSMGIAPEYMVASSYGKNTSINYMASVLRCAGYQEDGYPAGRWRLPTEAEIYYAIKLNNKNAIPHLFNGKYWASSGRYFDSSTSKWSSPTGISASNGMTGQTNGTGISVRCVYDTWYWGREEVTALMTDDNGKKPGCTSDTSQPQYTWSGYGYTTK